MRISGEVKRPSGWLGVAVGLACAGVGTFASFDGTEIWFEDQERGRPVVLLHGFAADANLNYVRSGIFDALVDEGRRTIAMDFRGHGLSGKPHEPAAYAGDALTRDVQALFDHLDLDGVAVVGYSMGARVALRLGAIDPRVRKVVALGGGGASSERGIDDQPSFAAAFLAEDPEAIDDPLGRQFRRLADSIRADRAALAACMRAPHSGVGDHLGGIAVPVLVIAGIDDDLAGDPRGLADRVADGRAITVPGDHFGANAQPTLHRALLGFV
ncbi:MAG: alpha/beta hydrolase [Acidimicrobiia bacterium]